MITIDLRTHREAAAKPARLRLCPEHPSASAGCGHHRPHGPRHCCVRFSPYSRSTRIAVFCAKGKRSGPRRRHAPPGRLPKHPRPRRRPPRSFKWLARARIAWAIPGKPRQPFRFPTGPLAEQRSSPWDFPRSLTTSACSAASRSSRPANRLPICDECFAELPRR